jgi:hypothetical protein
MFRPVTQRIFIVLGIGFVLIECMCLTLVFLIFAKLKTESSRFSRHTYRLHIQLTFLIIFQVSLLEKL